MRTSWPSSSSYVAGGEVTSELSRRKRVEMTDSRKPHTTPALTERRGGVTLPILALLGVLAALAVLACGSGADDPLTEIQSFTAVPPDLPVLVFVFTDP